MKLWERECRSMRQKRDERGHFRHLEVAAVRDGNVLRVRTELGVAHRLFEVEMAELNALGEIDEQAAAV